MSVDAPSGAPYVETLSFGQLLEQLQSAHLREIEGFRRTSEELRRELSEAKREAREETADAGTLAAAGHVAVVEATHVEANVGNQINYASVEEPCGERSLPNTAEEPNAVMRHSSYNADFDSSSLPPTRFRVLELVQWNGFDIGIGVVIILNACYIGVQTQTRVTGAPTPSWGPSVELTFTLIYVFELLLRYYALGFYEAMKSPWVKFDLFLAVSAGIDYMTIVFPQMSFELLQKIMVIRLLRLARLARVFRLMQQFKTLWLLVHGFANSLLTLVWTLVLLGVIVYIFSIFALEIIEPDESAGDEFNSVVEHNFGNLPKTVLTLLQGVTLDSVGSIYRPLILAQPALAIYFLAFILLVSIALMNLVTALMIESALDQSNQDKEVKRAWDAIEKKEKCSELRDLFHTLDGDKSGLVSMEELDKAPDDILSRFKEIAGTDDLKELFSCLDYDNSGTVSIDEFFDGIDKSSAGKLELYSLMLSSKEAVKKLHLMMGHVEQLRPSSYLVMPQSSSLSRQAYVV